MSRWKQVGRVDAPGLSCQRGLPPRGPGASTNRPDGVYASDSCFLSVRDTYAVSWRHWVRRIAAPFRGLAPLRLAPTADCRYGQGIRAQVVDLTADSCHNGAAQNDSIDCSTDRSANRSREMGPQTCRDHHAPTVEAALPPTGYGRAERRATRSALSARLASLGRGRRIPAFVCRHGVKGRTAARLSAIPLTAAHARRMRSIRMNSAFSPARQPSDGHRRSCSVHLPCRHFLPVLSTNDLGGGEAACD